MASSEESEQNTWQGLCLRFTQLANKEQDRLHQIEATGRRDHLYLYGYRVSGTGQWKFGGGPSADFREHVRTLAVRASIALGCPADKDQENFWLDRLYRYLLANTGSSHLSVASALVHRAGTKGEKRDNPASSLDMPDDSLVIVRVCGASAAFCSLLGRQALTNQRSR